MFRKYIQRLVLLMFAAVLMIGPAAVSADTKMEYPAQYLEVTVPDGILMFDRDTATNDPIWAKAGIFNIKDRKKEFESMGVIKAFYDENTDTLVTLNGKSNSATAETFSFTEMSDAEIIEYMEGQMATEDMDIDTTVTMYDGGEVPYFRVQILVNTPGAEAIEILYGTLINGSMLTYDLFLEGTTEADETLAKQLVNATHFSKILDRSEYDALLKTAYRKFLTLIAGIVLGFIALIVIARVFSKKKKERIHHMSELLAEFRKKKNEGKIAPSAPRFINDTVYDTALVDTFTFYNTWLKNIVVQGIVGICFLLVILYLFSKGGNSNIYAIFAAAIGISLLFMRNSYRDRMRVQMSKQYDISSKKTATIRFFDEYFVVSGISTANEFMYIQIQALKIYNGYIYLYISDNQAIILDGEGFTMGEPEELVEYVEQARKQKH